MLIKEGGNVCEGILCKGISCYYFNTWGILRQHNLTSSKLCMEEGEKQIYTTNTFQANQISAMLHIL